MPKATLEIETEVEIGTEEEIEIVEEIGIETEEETEIIEGTGKILGILTTLTCKDFT